MRTLEPFVPRTIRGQITIIIILVLLTVVIAGRYLESWARQDVGFPDVATLAERLNTVARLLRNADPTERFAIVSGARRAGMEMTLEDNGIVDHFRESAVFEARLSAMAEWLFPPDGVDPPPLGGWRNFLQGHRVLAARVDDKSVLVLRDVPDSVFGSGILGQGTYYLVAVITLVLFFSIFAVRVITEPIRRISVAADDADIANSSKIFVEKGSIEIVALAKALNGMRSRIRLMVESRTRMLRGIGHDVRTPLTRMRLRAERMEASPVRDALLADILRINSLLAESLSFLRDDYTTESIQRTNIASILQTVVAEYSDVGFDVTYDGPGKLIVNCKPLAMTRAITNLCDNGTKFGKSVGVSLKERASGFEIVVSDDGPGIDAELRQRVFEPFFKVDQARGSERDGFGLGLSIVADIIHAHRGEIQLTESYPHGLAAKVSIPPG